MTSVNSLANTGRSLLDVTAPPAQRTTGASMTQSDFLNIMIQQMKSQNPLDASSSDSTAFFSQMVQFQQLSAMTSMQQAIQTLTQVGQLSNATALIGKSITANAASGNDPVTGLPKPAQVVSGLVQSVTFDPTNGATLHLDSNIAVAASAVTKVE